MEARAVDQTTGEAIVYDTLVATALPGPLYSVDTNAEGRQVWETGVGWRWVPIPLVLQVGDSLDLPARVVGVRDRYQNQILGWEAMYAMEWSVTSGDPLQEPTVWTPGEWTPGDHAQFPGPGFWRVRMRIGGTGWWPDIWVEVR